MTKNKQGKKSARQQLNEDLVARPGGAIGKSRKQARKNEKEEAILDGLDAINEDYEIISEAFGWSDLENGNWEYMSDHES